MSQPTPGEFWLQFPRVIGEGQLDDPTPPGWPLWRTTYLCTASPMRMLSKWPWISRCGDYWQQAELRTDGACRMMMMMMMFNALESYFAATVWIGNSHLNPLAYVIVEYNWCYKYSCCYSHSEVIRVVSQDELRALQQKITNKIDMGNAYVFSF